MTFDLSIPLAEQYPSKMAVSSVVASQRISGTAHLAEKARRMTGGRAGAKYGGRNTGKHLGGFLFAAVSNFAQSAGKCWVVENHVSRNAAISPVADALHGESVIPRNL